MAHTLGEFWWLQEQQGVFKNAVVTDEGGLFFTSQLSLGPRSMGEMGLLLGATGLISSPISLSIFSVSMCCLT